MSISTADDLGDIRNDVSEAAKDKAKAALRKKNKGEWQCSLTLLGCLDLREGCTFNVSGYGVYDGKYFADTVTHRIDGSGGFTTEVEGHRVLNGY